MLKSNYLFLKNCNKIKKDVVRVCSFISINGGEPSGDASKWTNHSSCGLHRIDA